MTHDARCRGARSVGRLAARAGVATLVAAAVLAPLAPLARPPEPPVRLLGARTVADPAPPPSRPRAVAPVHGRVLRNFQPPPTPYGRGHRGVDLAAVPGEPVRAARAGTVTFAGLVAGVGWVTVAHGDGFDTTYGGLEPAVRDGDQVPIGGVLGRATRAGRIDWGARHWGAQHSGARYSGAWREARYIDPLGLLGGWRVRLVPGERGS